MPHYTSPEFDNLIAGFDGDFKTVPVIIPSGNGVVLRGTVFGSIGRLPESDPFAGTQQVVPVNSTLTNGGQNPAGILVDDVVDTTNGDVRAVMYVTGIFNRDALIFGGNDTIADHENALNAAGLTTKRVVKGV
ncbi:hypothetical protein AK95_14475 [Paenibacillus sp. LC231]|uniref:head decoration protein n=1 Tax=Paenibacillus sp. LC231 TaxID=1120679 RepID=UPI0008DD8E67|nr:head decoration protein [Paenibacillus sp. LC231]OIB04819.1 hypothetical protein AK95_14475 [Paenibacillus sp. LC231]